MIRPPVSITKILLWVCRYLLAVLLVFFGVLGLFEFLMHGYDPANVMIQLYSDPFKNFFNAMMATVYLPLSVRSIEVISGVLLFTKRYWFIGTLLHLPVATNVLAVHLLMDIPPAHNWFFVAGMAVSLPNFLLILMEWRRLKSLVVE